jgi:Pyruvate/2-oxoacid:ferredoxin oxidoreductase delta subunit
MSSARTTCPECDRYGPNVVDLADLLYSPRVDYFRCRACGCWWMVPKNADEPATRIVLGNPNASVIVKQAS